MSLRIATVGNVDHGKSTLLGRLLADTNQLHNGQFAKVDSYCSSQGRKFEYAYLLDALEEEQTQGITIDSTEVRWEFRDHKFCFVDTPGHREFLKKMVGAASRVDAAVLLIDAQIGVTPNFRRHLKVLELLGVKDVLVLINKMDLTNWDRDVFDYRAQELSEILRRLGFQYRIIPVSAYLGENLVHKSSFMDWYAGPTFAEVLLALNENKLERSQPPTRYFVQDVYSDPVKSIVVGRLESGRLRVGDQLTFHPENRTQTIRSLEVYGEVRSEFKAGDAAAITFLDDATPARGSMGYPPQAQPLFSNEFVADLFWLHDDPALLGQELTVKIGTRSVGATLVGVQSEFDSEGEDTRSENQLALFGRVRLRLDEILAFDRFFDCEPTGRFVLSLNQKIVGGGRILGCARENLPEGQVFWFTGLSGAGKSTIARALAQKWGSKVTVLDGDEMRLGLCHDLNYTDEDRLENVRRVAEVAKILANAGQVVIAALISPRESHRQKAREIIGSKRFHEVFIDCPLEVCERRDVKGLYAKARRDELSHFTGVDSRFESPLQPQLRLDTHSQELSVVVASLQAYCDAKLLGFQGRNLI